MELALQFENLNCEELCAIDGGKRNYFNWEIREKLFGFYKKGYRHF